jgi:WD40 repeat protein
LAAWSSDGTKIGVVVRHSFDQYALRIYRASAEEHEQQITISELFSSSDYSKQITSLDWDSSGRYLAAVNRNPIVYIVDSVNGTVIASADYSSEDSTAYVADVTIDWHPVDTLLGIQQRNMPIDILSTQGEIQTSNTPSLGTDFVWDNAGDRVIIVTNQSVEFRDLETGNIEQTLEEFDGFVEKIALQPVGTIMAGVGSMRGGRLQVWLWDVDSGQIVATLE